MELKKTNTTEKVIINWENIAQYSAVPLGYRFVDHAEIIPGKEGWGRKAVSSLDWYFKVHFPGNPVMPGVFLMEVMQQTGLLIVTTMAESKTDILLFHSCESMRMYRSVRPGDILSAHVVLVSYRHGVARFDGSIAVYDEVEKTDKTVCAMKFTLISQADMPCVSVKISNRGGKIFDWRNMDFFTSDPIGYRFIDRVNVLSPESAWGEKNVSMAEWYYSLLVPNELMMPNAFILESIMQTCVFAINSEQTGASTLLLFNGCQAVSFHRTVRPGDQLITHGKVERICHGVSFCSGFAAVGDELVCDMKFTLIAPESMVKVR